MFYSLVSCSLISFFRFLESVMVLYCLFYWPTQLVCSQEMSADIRGWNTVMRLPMGMKTGRGFCDLLMMKLKSK